MRTHRITMAAATLAAALLCACLLAAAASGGRVGVDDMVMMHRFRAWQAKPIFFLRSSSVSAVLPIL